MRYIRTKDGMIDRDAVPPHIIVDGYIDFNSGGRFKIVEEADSIEELCDAYVRVFIKKSKDWKPRVLRDKDDQMLILLEHEDYAAIWTDKGLIYVAKMNEKGELELI